MEEEERKGGGRKEEEERDTYLRLLATDPDPKGDPLPLIFSSNSSATEVRRVCRSTTTMVISDSELLPR